MSSEVENTPGDSKPPVSRSRRLVRPTVEWSGGERRATCAYCGDEVGDTLGAPAVPTRRLAGHYPLAVEPETIPVRGYLCDPCDAVLAISPVHTQVSVVSPGGVDDPRESDPSAGWVAIPAFDPGGRILGVVVPLAEVDLWRGGCA